MGVDTKFDISLRCETNRSLQANAFNQILAIKVHVKHNNSFIVSYHLKLRSSNFYLAPKRMNMISYRGNFTYTTETSL